MPIKVDAIRVLRDVEGAAESNPAAGGGVEWKHLKLGAEAAPNRPRVERALALLNRMAQESPKVVTPDLIQTLAWGIGTPRGRDPEALEGVMGVVHAVLAAHTLSRLPAPARTQFAKLLAEVGTKAPKLERVLLLKHLAALSNRLLGDKKSAAGPLTELTEFAARIRGREQADLVKQVTVVDLDGDEVDEGLLQRYPVSCQPTTFQILGAEANPKRAWDFVEEGIEGRPLAGAITAEQRRILEQARLTSFNEDGTMLYSRGGTPPGEAIDELLTTHTNMEYLRNEIAGPVTMERTLNRLAGYLEDGIDVPVNNIRHAMSFTDVREGKNGREFLVQDPQGHHRRWFSQEWLVGQAKNADYNKENFRIIWTFEPRADSRADWDVFGDEAAVAEWKERISGSTGPFWPGGQYEDIYPECYNEYAQIARDGFGIDEQSPTGVAEPDPEKVRRTDLKDLEDRSDIPLEKVKVALAKAEKTLRERHPETEHTPAETFTIRQYNIIKGFAVRIAGAGIIAVSRRENPHVILEQQVPG